MQPDIIVSRMLERGRLTPERVCCYYKAGGHWTPIGWGAVREQVLRLAGGFLALGLEAGGRVAILSNTRQEWIGCDMAIQAVGGVAVGIYPSMIPEQVRYVLDHAETRFVVVEDRKQLVKVQQVRDALPGLARIIVIDPRDTADGEGIVLPYDELLELGKGREAEVEARLARVRLADPALFVYTSGTTGPPKGAVISHGNVMACMRATEVIDVSPDDMGMSFLPLAHVLQRAVDYRGIYLGTPGYYAESVDKLPADLIEARPTVMAAVPRVFEKIYAGIQAQVARSSPARQRIFHWAIGIGRRVSELRVRGQAQPPGLAVQHRIARALVFDRLRDRMGGRMRLLVTGGAPIAREILEFFHAADIEVLEAWGMSETFGPACSNLPGQQRFGTIGKPLPGVEMKIADDGEILVRGPTVFTGYYRDEEATRQSFTEDGYFRTGDIAEVDAEGFFKIVDRKKDLIITAGGKKIPPQNLENDLKQQPCISQAMVYGDRKPYLVALVTLDENQLSDFARARGLPTDPLALAARPEVVELVQRAVDAVNQHLASYERIKYFRIVPGDFTQEGGEITPSLKIKRKVVTEKYRELIEGMYAASSPAQASA